MILGIDFGSTTTKIVLMNGTKIEYMNRIEHDEDYLQVVKSLDTDNISMIVTVGAGASFIEGDILGIPTRNVEEFQAVALGGYYLSGLDECMVISLGTGTSFIYVNYNKREHAGGAGIGGGLLAQLASYRMSDYANHHFKNAHDLDEFLTAAGSGNPENADLLIKHISKTDIGDLFGDVTVANMARLNADSTLEDYAYGVCNLVFQNVGVMAVMADRPYNTKKVVVMGTLSQYEIAKKCLDAVGDLFGYDFIIPENSGFGVAIGAVLLCDPDYENKVSFYGMNLDHIAYIFE